MAADNLIPGEVAWLPMRVTDFAGQAADPGSITLLVRPPASAPDSYVYGAAPEVIRDGVGAYHAEIPLTAAGQWAYRWELGAPNAGAAEGVITVFKSRVI